MMWAFALIGVLLVIGILLWSVWLTNKKRYLNGKALQKVREVWQLIEHIDDGHKQVMEADKLIDHALSMLGYRGTLGEKLKKAGPRFSDLDGLWRAHKLRNTLAHELHAEVSEGNRKTAMHAFQKALTDLGMK